jgi:ElaB/YqjD/DUF883 family membrane-anchored ribosome-binding protein
MARRNNRSRNNRGNQPPPAPAVPPAMNPTTAAEATSLAASVKYLDQQALSWQNVLKAKKEAAAYGQKIADSQERLNKMGPKAQRQAADYAVNLGNIEREQRKLIQAKQAGDVNAISSSKALLGYYQDQQTLLMKTAGGREKAQQIQDQRSKKTLLTEIALINIVNKNRTIGDKLRDIFRSKEEKQARIDIARAKATGTANIKPEGSGGGDEKSAASKVGAGLAAGAKKTMSVMEGAVGKVNTALTVPLAGAANLLTGEDYGMGGGKANASGATSILGSFSSLIKQIPFVGGLLGGLVDIFKTMLDAMLGIDQANFRVGRALNISADAAQNMREQFDGVANSSGNIVVNSTRMLQSQVEISKQLGTNKQLSSDILVNDVKLRDILGLEAESRQKIAESSIVTGRNATKLTQGIIGTVGAFNKLVGTSFKFNDIIAEASKMSGVMGLTFAKYPEKLTKAILSVKTLGFDLKQLDSTAESFLDFEGSISKEMEAQVLTGRDLNLNAAREAALNNDNAKLAQEITKNVGSASEYLGMNRIQQEAIASAVGMTRDSLADVLKKQEMYSKLGATDLKTFNERIALMEKQGKTQEQISALIGKDNYNTYTQVSTAEKLTEVMERIKKTFVDFMKSSGIFDFITKPEKVNAFISGLVDKLGGFIKFIGNAIATLLEGLGSFVGIFSSSSGEQLKSIAQQARGGSAELGNSIQAIGANLGGATSNSVSGTKEKGAQKEATKSQQAVQQSGAGQPMNYGPQMFNVGLNIDGVPFTNKIFELAPQSYQATKQH